MRTGVGSARLKGIADNRVKNWSIEDAATEVDEVQDNED
jgi:hypothetical protein